MPPSPAGRSRRVFPNITRSAASDVPPVSGQIRTQHGGLTLFGDAKGRAAHRSALPSVGHASDQATFKFVADSLPLFRSASRSYVTFMPSARPFIPDQTECREGTDAAKVNHSRDHGLHVHLPTRQVLRAALGRARRR